MKPKKGQFKFYQRPEITYRPSRNTAESGQYEVIASKFGKKIGYMKLYAPGEHDASEGKSVVRYIHVDKPHRRKGVATAMWQNAKANELFPEHSSAQTESGKAWAKKVGD